MVLKLLLLFTLVPLVELWLLIEVGKIIGTWLTILLVASTGFFGVLLACSQGLMVLYKMRAELRQGLLPADELFDSVFILLGGAFLVTPGFLTDCLGFSFLIPATRYFFKREVKRFIRKKMESGQLHLWRRW